MENKLKTLVYHNKLLLDDSQSKETLKAENERLLDD